MGPAALEGDSLRMKSLLERGWRPDARDRCGYTPLHYAAPAGHLACVRALLQCGASADDRTGGGATALQRAAGRARLPVVACLLEAGADPTLTDDRGQTALHRAAELADHNRQQEVVEVCKLLIDSSPSIACAQDSRGNRAADLARLQWVRKLLMTAGDHT